MSATLAIGLPLYGDLEHLPRALESLLGQSHTDLAVVVVDDGSTDGSLELARDYARTDSRLHVSANPERLGLTANWRRAYELARELHPGARYFAWASGHDVWHPRWAGRLVAELERRPDLLLAYPLSAGIGLDGRVERLPWRFDTATIARPGVRLARAARDMRAGDMVYGVFRAEAPGRVGGFRSVLWPDRLLLAELAAEGPFGQVPELLWWRRLTAPGSPARQRGAFYPGGAPAWSRLPWPLQHAGAIAAAGKPGLAARYLALSGPIEIGRELLRARNRAGARLLEVAPALGALLGRAEAGADAAGLGVKLRPSAPEPFEAMAMVNRHPRRPPTAERSQAADPPPD